MDNSMLQALADYIRVKSPTPFKLQRQNGVIEYADYEFEEQLPEPPRKNLQNTNGHYFRNHVNLVELFMGSKIIEFI